MREVKSSWSRERGEAHPRLAESPGSRSSPSNARADGHIARHVGKGSAGLASISRGGTPVQRGQRGPTSADE
jgi:hypothetical protein